MIYIHYPLKPEMNKILNQKLCLISNDKTTFGNITHANI